MKKEKIIGIIANKDFLFKKMKEEYLQKLYYSVPDLIIKNLADINPYIVIPHQMNFIEYYVNLIDGLILIGSDNDIPPSCYNEEAKFDLKTCKEKSVFEIQLLKTFLKTNKPILGICAGMQALNVAQDGTLYQNIRNELNLEHEQKIEMSQTYHKILIDENTKLFNIFQEKETYTNSCHNQCIKKLGKDLIISARCEDGIIEAIELKNHKFCMGIQWHPECNSNPKDELIFQSFQNNL